jgi:DNA (cytosine-5)-methyltransferase 1
MRYLSVCSGIEAATVAWHPLGWEAVGFAEIDKFPSTVLGHHYPDVPNFGDFTTIKADDVGAIDLLVGGTPCQSFSIAGLRGGLADDRGNLALEFLRLAQRARPRWLVWENVPGVLSSNGGRDFGAILGGMVECGYGFAYRVLDAQYFGLAQRRKRVFVVGYLGDWRRAAAVFLERESLRWNPPPRSRAWQDIAGTLAAGAHPSGFNGRDAERGNIVAPPLTGNLISHSLNAKGGSGRIDAESETFVTHSLRAEGFDASEDGTGRGIPLIPVAYRVTGNDGAYELGDLTGCLNTGTDRSAQVVAFHENQRGELTVNDTAGSLKVGGGKPGQGYPAVAVSLRGREGGATAEISGDTMPALRTGGGGGDKPHALNGSAVRRLTPRECERLQGFPDDYTLIPYRGKQAADGPRYRALGNSMAVPVMNWIGKHIQAVASLSEGAV